MTQIPASKLKPLDDKLNKLSPLYKSKILYTFLWFKIIRNMLNMCFGCSCDGSFTLILKLLYSYALILNAEG